MMSEDQITQLQADLDARNESIRLQQVAIEQQERVMAALNQAQEAQVQTQIDLIRAIAEASRG